MRAISRLLAAGVRHQRAGQRKKAESACRQVLARNPDDPDALHLLGSLALEAGETKVAAVLLARAIRIQGPDPRYCLTLAFALRASGDLAGSSACLRQAMRANPFDPELPYQEGVNLILENRIEEAASAFMEAMRLDPEHGGARLALSRLAHLLGRPHDALAGYRLVLRDDPRNAEALYYSGHALQDLDRLEEAEEAFRASLSHVNADAHCDLGVVLRALGRPLEAARAYRAALRISPEHREALYNLGLALLVMGEFEAGWEGYENRALPPPPPLPRWDGSPLAGRAILLQAEQGFGDTIQFIRYAALMEGGDVAVACQEEVLALIRRAPGVDRAAGPGEPPGGCACYVPLLSLPRVFRTTAETVPGRVPYLAAAAAPVREWSLLLHAPASHAKVGIAWAGSPGHRNDRNRSIAPESLAVLADVPGVTFFSLQKEFPRGCAALPFAPLGRDLTDFADTAALMMNLDLVISVDTAVAHLAGALGKPVWTLLPFAPDWRWMLGRDDTPWYPSMRLFRQQRRSDWEPVLARVRGELAAEAARIRARYAL